MQAVGAWQVEHRVTASGRRVEAAFLALDGDARVIGDLLAAAGEQVEQRGLAAIGVAHQGDADGVAALMRPAPEATTRYGRLRCGAGRSG